jgi:putative flavoprotein involved in K+ transport
VTEAPGLYFLGLTWQHTRGSALIGWVKDDAEFIAGRIEARQQGGTRSTEPEQLPGPRTRERI